MCVGIGKQYHYLQTETIGHFVPTHLESECYNQELFNNEKLEKRNVN